MRFKYPQPADENDFELLCVKLLRRHWNSRQVELHAHRGEEQNGVDIIDLSGTIPLRAGQCKLHDPAKSIPPSEISGEVDKAKTFIPAIGVYTIMTTAKVSAKAQQRILEINLDHRARGLFTVELMAWNQMEELIAQYPEVQDEVYNTVAGQTVARFESKLDSIGASIGLFVNEAALDAFDAAIDEARAYLLRHEFQEARLLFQRIRNRDWQKLSDRQKFRVLTNIAVTLAQADKPDEAATLLFEAKSHQPDEEKALANEAWAYQLLEQPERAFSAATDALDKHPNSTYALAIWISSAPSGTSIDELEARVPSHLAIDGEVSMALAQRSILADDLERAEHFARRAVSSQPDWPNPLAALGHVLVQGELDRGRQRFAEPPIVNESRMEEAIGHLTKAITLAKSQRATAIEADALLKRSVAHRTLGCDADANRDVEEAYRLQPNDYAVLRTYAWLLYIKGEKDRAIDSWRRAVGLGDEGDSSLMLAWALRQRGDTESAREATDLFLRLSKNLAQLRAGQRAYALEFTVDSLIEQQRWDEADQLLATVGDSAITPVATAMLLGTLRLAQGDSDGALSFAGKALARVDDATPWRDKRRLAIFLTTLGRDSDALPLWQQVVVPEAPGGDTKLLVQCAHRVGRHDVALEICKAARDVAFHDDWLLNLELHLLERYDPSAAIQIMQNHLVRQPDDRMIRLRLSLLGWELGRNDLIETDPSRLPGVDEIDVAAAPAVVQVLRAGGRPNEALTFGYEIMRRYFFEPEAHTAFLIALHPFGDRPDVTNPEAVVAGSAVCYREENGSEQWLIIEDSPNPNAALGERAPNDLLAQAMIGKRVGDNFVLAKGSVKDRVALIIAILSKYIYRYNDCLHQWQVRFPGQPGVESVNLRKQGGGDADYDFSPILRSADERSQRVADVEKVFREKVMPLHVFGEALGGNILETVFHFAYQTDVPIRCCAGTAEERETAIAALSTCNAIVLHLSAIATLKLIDCLSVLRDWPVRLVVSQNSLDELRAFARLERGTAHDGGHLVKAPRGHVLIEETRDEGLKRADQIDELIDLVGSSCDVVACPELSAVPPALRAQVIKLFGQDGAESILIAKRPGHVLWADDLALRIVAQNEHSVRAVWTQVALQSRFQTGTLTATEYVGASAKLVGFRYAFTSLSPEVFVRAMEVANWNPNERPLQQALEQFAAETTELPGCLRLAAQGIVQLFRKKLIPATRSAIVLAILESFAGKEGGIEGIRNIRDALPALFGVNVVHTDEVMSIFDAWLKHADKRLIRTDRIVVPGR